MNEKKRSRAGLHVPAFFVMFKDRDGSVVYTAVTYGRNGDLKEERFAWREAQEKLAQIGINDDAWIERGWMIVRIPRKVVISQEEHDKWHRDNPEYDTKNQREHDACHREMGIAVFKENQ